MNARLLILQILNDFPTFFFKDMDNIIAKYQLSQVDKNFVKEVLQGIGKHRLTLYYIIKKYSREVPQKKIENCLLLALYQFFYLEKVPAHAIIHSTVELVKKINFKAHKYVNAVLRNIQRDTQIKNSGELYSRNYLPIDADKGWLFPNNFFPNPEKNKIKYLSTIYSYPNFLIKKWIENFSLEECIKLLQLGNMRPCLTLRVRNRENFNKYAETMGICNNNVVTIPNMGSITQMPGYEEGDWVVQGITSIQTIEAINIEQNSLVLDLCAAPGGKSIHMADNMKNTGTILSCDKSLERLKTLQKNVQKLHLTNIHPIVLQAEHIPTSFYKKFDCVLIDAPCSNSAVFSKRAGARWRFSAKNLTKLQKLQQKILYNGAKAVKDGGILIYSTCSLEPEENETNIHSFLDKNENFQCFFHKKIFPQSPQLDGGTFFIIKKMA